MITTLIAEQLFDGTELHKDCAISFEDGRVIALNSVSGARVIEVPGVLVPGFIDTQVNGGGGYLFNHQTNVQTLAAMVKAHARYGTTALLPTLITSDFAKQQCAADVIADAIAQKLPGILGIHFEGPHISELKKGIHSSDYIRELSQQELDLYSRDDLGIKVITLAPENISTASIKALVEQGVIVCLGHSNASLEQTEAAIAAGAIGFTHLFNAMSALTSREPNMVGAALLDENTWCGLILDGHHVHPNTAKLANKVKPNGKMMLVTDAMSTIGSDQTEFTFDGHTIALRGDKLTSQTGQLAGSALDMNTAVNNAQLMLGVSVDEALNMASLYPAQFLNISAQRGQISVGANADFTVLSSTHPSHHVVNTWINGKQEF